MQRIDHSTATADELFTEGDPSSGIPATIVTADWLNSMQEEVANVIEAAGITLDSADDTQLLQALNIISSTSKFFTLQSDSAADWSAPSLTLNDDLNIIFRSEAGERRVNVLPAGVYSISDGSILVFRRELTSASPVTLTPEGVSYADLSEGQYLVLAETSLTLDFLTDEVLLFRNRGGKLEVATTGTLYSDDSRITFGEIQKTIMQSPFMVPVGAIIPFYDFNGALPINSDHWAYCDGSTVDVTYNDTTVSRILPDTSGRYLVGFGTDGAGDVDSAAWSTSPVGNANHEVDLQHDHTVNAHTHDVNIGSYSSNSSGSHSHTVTAHNHSISSGGSHDHSGRTTGMSTTATEDSANYRVKDDSAGWGNRTTDSIHIEVTGGSNNEGHHDHNISSDGSHDHGGNTGNSSPSTSSDGSHTHTNNPPNTTSTSATPGTSLSLSTTQSIQPRSIQVRYIMRVQ